MKKVRWLAPARCCDGSKLASCWLQVEEVMSIQRAEGVFKEDFELDVSQIKPQSRAPEGEFQPDQTEQPQRKKPSWMKPGNSVTPPGHIQDQRNRWLAPAYALLTLRRMEEATRIG